MRRTTRPVASFLLAAALASGLSACGESREEQLRKASEMLQSTREEVAKAREEVRTKEQAAASTEKELLAARETLRDAETRLAEAESKVDLKATDEMIFRAVQKALLDDKALRDTAITASVDHGVVKLTGRVREDKLAQRAVEIARKAPGVAGVQNEIEVAAAPES